jgi:thiol:disulfide interchange protein
MLLEAADPVALMTHNEDEYVATRRPSTATANVKMETLRLVEQNTALLEKLQATSVPTIVYRNRLNHEPAITKGALSTEQLAELFGAPARTLVAN